MPAADERQRREVRRVPVARDDLRRDRLRLEAERARARAPRSSGDRCAYVPTAPAIFPTAISRARRLEPRAAARDLRVVPGEREPERDRLGEDAVAAPDHRRLRVLARAVARARRGACRTARAACRPRRASGSRATCRARRSTSSRGAASARSSPASSSTCVRNAMTSCFVVRSISSMRAGSSTIFLARIAAAVPRRDEARVFHRLARRELDLEPHGEAARGGPELGEVGGGVARDHAAAELARTGARGHAVRRRSRRVARAWAAL